MNKLLTIVVAGVAILLAGCATQSVQKLPALSVRCTVIDHVTRNPIAGAWVLIVDRAGDNDDGFQYGPFVTDGSGIANVEVRARRVGLTGSAFYYRSAEVEARGYGARTFDLDTPVAREALKSGAPYTFDLFPARVPNRRLRTPPKTITMR